MILEMTFCARRPFTCFEETFLAETLRQSRDSTTNLGRQTILKKSNNWNMYFKSFVAKLPNHLQLKPHHELWNVESENAARLEELHWRWYFEQTITFLSPKESLMKDEEQPERLNFILCALKTVIKQCRRFNWVAT